ncbi:MAG: glycosyltransferase [bacterium]|jgi:glycosyltransferase involved in cell wall biosynthesis|nr:glycosyltransferase [bacterium]
MKIALVHDYLIQSGGAEKVVDVMHGIWPKAPLYTLLFDPKNLPEFEGRDIRTSFLKRLPLARRKYQWYLPLMPTATEHYNLKDFDIVISSTSAFAKGVITGENTLHICYCHTPTRYLWSDTHSYIEELRIPRFVKALLPPVLSRLRIWDKQAADRVDLFIANSETVKQRIKKYYRKDAHVIHPPVDTHLYNISNKPKEYFLIGGRLVAYKRYDMVIEAANRTGLPLKIFGSGPVEADLKKMAGPNVEFLGRVDEKTKAKLYANAKAFINPQEEDFGITPVESMAAGRPVIAWRKGGATETVKEGVSGEFFDEQSWEELADHMIRFDESKYDARKIKAHAETFSRKNFETKLMAFIENARKQKSSQE